MKRSPSIKLKAVFLLIVFSSSTLVSFACAAGLDMGYNKDHHEVQAHPSATEHAGIDHNHSNNALHEHVTIDKRGLTSHEGEVDHHEKKGGDKKESSPDDCCRDEAAKFEKCDKLSPQTFNYNFQDLFITFVINPYLNADAITLLLHTPNSKYFIRNHHPPIADTRIAIQSFLI